VAFLQAVVRPKFRGPRSASIARSQVWLGLPAGCFQSGGTCRIHAARAQWWSSRGELRAIWPKSRRRLLVTRWESGEQPVVLLTSVFNTWRVYGILKISRSAHVSNALVLRSIVLVVLSLNVWDSLSNCHLIKGREPQRIAAGLKRVKPQFANCDHLATVTILWNCDNTHLRLWRSTSSFHLEESAILSISSSVDLEVCGTTKCSLITETSRCTAVIHIHRVRKKGTDSILFVTLTNLDNFL